MPRFWYSKAAPPAIRPAALLMVAIGLAACEPEAPRSYSEYLEDPIAREATLLRCNSSRDASRGDTECINAKRAAAALAAHSDAEKRRRFEAESERKRAALSERIAARQAAEQQQLAEMKRRESAAYEQRWSYADATGAGADTAGYPTGEEFEPETQHDIYAGQQFPAPPLQPGVSDPAQRQRADAAANYLGGEAQPGYSLSNGADVIDPAGAAQAPAQALPDLAPADVSAVPSMDDLGVSPQPTADSTRVPQPQQVIEDPSAADPSWQPFEPPPGNQPGEG